MQIFAFGRAANEAFLKSDGYEDAYVAPSAIKLSDRLSGNAPRELTLEEISEYIQLHVTAAKNAVFGAGLDGVEVHGANGYLMDQFNQEMANQRTDKYGGSIENRARFALEVVDAVSAAIGAKRTAFRLSPYSTFQGTFQSLPETINFC
jgi:NADPH2 dehydrogenase